MLAVRLHGNSDLRVDQMPEPDAAGPGQVRVEPQWCGICGTDLHEYAHGPLYTPAENLPQRQAGLDACVASVRRAATVAVIAIHLGDRLVQPEGWVWRDLTVAGVWSFKIWDTPRILAQIAAGTLPVERVVTSRIGMHDVVRKGIQRLADPGGGQVKILVSAAGQDAAGKDGAGQEGAR